MVLQIKKPIIRKLNSSFAESDLIYSFSWFIALFLALSHFFLLSVAWWNVPPLQFWTSDLFQDKGFQRWMPTSKVFSASWATFQCLLILPQKWMPIWYSMDDYEPLRQKYISQISVILNSQKIFKNHSKRKTQCLPWNQSIPLNSIRSWEGSLIEK